MNEIIYKINNYEMLYGKRPTHVTISTDKFISIVHEIERNYMFGTEPFDLKADFFKIYDVKVIYSKSLDNNEFVMGEVFNL